MSFGGTAIGRGVIPVHLDTNAVETGMAALVSRMKLKMSAAGLAAGGALTAGIGAVVGGGIALAKIGETFEEMDQIISKATGASGKRLEELGETAREVAKQTPADFSDIAVAIGQLHARTGAVGKDLADTALGIIRLTRVTGTELKSNIAADSRLFKDWSITTEGQAFALDKLLSASQHTGIEVDRLAQLMVQFGSPLRQLGFNFDRTAAMFAQFEAQGVNMTTLIPGMRFALKTLAEDSEALPSAQLAVADAQQKLNKALKEGGANSIEAQKQSQALGAAQKNLKFIALVSSGDLPQGLAAGMKAIKQAGTVAEANSISFELFGRRAGPDAAAAIREHRFELGKLQKALKDSRGQLAETTKENRTIGGAWETLGNKVAVALQPLASPVFKVFRDNSIGMADGIGRVVDRIGPFLAGLSKGTGTAGRLGTSLGKFADVVLPAIREQFDKVVAIIGPSLEKISDNLKKNFLPALEAILPVLAPVAKFVIGIIGSAVIGAIKGAVQALNGLVTVISGVFNIIAGIVHGDWGQVWKGVKQVLTGALDFIIGAIKVWWNLGILNLFRKGALALLTATRGLWKAIPGLFVKGGELVGKVFFKGLRALGSLLLRGIKGYFTLWKNLWSGLLDLAGFGLRTVLKFIGASLRALGGIIVGAVKSYVGFWRGLFDTFVGIGGKLMGLIRDTIPKAFKLGVAAIGRIFGSLRDLAMKPVRFIVDTVYTEGIRRVVNAIPGVGDLPEIKLAKGGPVPVWGRRHADSVRAMLTPDEHVWTEDEVKGAGGHRAVKRLRELAKKRRIRRLGDPGWDLAPGYADGGAVSISAVYKALQWAAQQVGKPYIWGGTGPGGFDCSGYMSGITNVLRGGSGYGTRYGTTATFPWAGFQPGYGAFTIGNSKRYGHMGGTLGGVGVESTNSSVRMGAVARGASDPMFDQHYHLGAAGPASGPGSIRSILGDIKSLYGKITGWVGDLRKMGGWGGMIGSMLKSLTGDLKEFITDKIGSGAAKSAFGLTPIGSVIHGVGGLLHDKGGMWKPGLGLNLSGHPERVLTARQNRAFERLVLGATYAGGGLLAGLGAGAEFRMRITNWETGEAVVRVIARDEMGSESEFDATIHRMGGDR